MTFHFASPSRRQFLAATVGGAIGASVLQSRAMIQVPELSNSKHVHTVRLLGNQFLDNPINVTGADGATSTVLPSGDALWVFGDTLVGPFKTIRNLELTSFCSNTAAMVPPQDASAGIKQFSFLTDAEGKGPRQLVPFAPNENPAEHRVWAIHGTCIDKQIYLFYHRITLLKGTDVFINFQLDGIGVARAKIDDLKFTRLAATDGTLELWKGNEPSFGVWIQQVDDYVYLWGNLMTGMHLARVHPESIEDFSSYEYLVKAPTTDNPDVEPVWSKKFESTGMLFDAVPNEMSASYNPFLRKYIAFHSLHREPQIVLRTAEKPTGPWSEPAIVFRPERLGDADLIYAAKEHPELARDGGRIIYVTFVNSATYVPQLIEVTLQ